ncbi:MAG: DUF4277 domain-containing protein [Desulfoferrobacter sp.]
MKESGIQSVQTQGVGFGPIVRAYLEKAGIARIIDEHVPLDPRRKILSHGEAAVAMITGILFQVLQLYRLVPFAKEATVLQVIFPHIKPEEYFDDRLSDTLHALFNYGLGNLEMLLTQNCIKEFEIKTQLCHNDTTSASVYGEC